MDGNGKCMFNKTWAGLCKKPSVSPIEGLIKSDPYGFCEDHAGLKCCSCGDLATGSCPEPLQLVCGAPLCDYCSHNSYPYSRKRHTRNSDNSEETMPDLEDML